MANKRSLKHTISLVCDELFVECVAASLYGKENHQDNAEAILHSIIKLESHYYSRISHPEPGMTAHNYFKDLREKFAIEVSEILDQINNL